MLIPASGLRQEPCDQDADINCATCYCNGCNEWMGLTPATKRVTPPNGREEFVCDQHARSCEYDTELEQFIYGTRTRLRSRSDLDSRPS